MENEAILTILKQGQQGLYEIVGSEVLELEIERIRDEQKKLGVKELYKVVKIRILYTEDIKKRAQEIMSQSKIRTFDSLHIAAAEYAKSDVLLTTDDKLEKMAAALYLKVKVQNPLKFVWEVL